jgi:putative endonuclease
MTSCRRSVYVLVSTIDPERHYVGLTSNVTTRLAVHNAGGSRHTAQYRPWRLMVWVEFASPSSAAAFEKYLKTGSGRAFAKRHLA